MGDGSCVSFSETKRKAVIAPHKQGAFSLPPSLSPSRPSVRRRLSIILIGGSAEGSDGQMRARSPSLPQRQQRRSCVLLPTSSCSAARLPPSPAGPSLLSSFLPPPPPCPSPARSQWRASAVSRKGDVPFGCGNIKAETRDEETCHRGRSGCVRERLHFSSHESRACESVFVTRDGVLLH